MGNRLDKRKDADSDSEDKDCEDNTNFAIRNSSNIYNRKIKEFTERELQKAKRKSAPAFFDNEEIQKIFSQPIDSAAFQNINRSNSVGLFYRNQETFKFYGRTEASREVLQNELYLKCKERLNSYYLTKNIYMRSMVWDGRGYDFLLSQYLVPFNLKNGDLCGRKKKDDVLLKDILPKDGRKIILVTAGPGFGKSTLCMKIGYDWASDSTSGYLKHYDIVIIVPLSSLNEKTIINAILESTLEESEREIVKGLKHVNLNFLIVLDGYDEVCNRKFVMDFINTDSFLISSRMTIIIMSRPHAVQELRKHVDDCITIEGFGKENQKKYIEFFNLALTRDNEEHVKSLNQLLEDDPSLLGLAECPLMLHMLCCLHWERSIAKLERKTDLYIWLFSQILNRYIRKKGGNGKLKIGKHFYGEDILIKLGKLAWNCLFTNDPLTSDNVEETFVDEEEFNVIVGLDVLIYSYSTFEGREITIYEPIHKIFFQFLSALYISSHKELMLNLSVKCIFDEDIFLFTCGFMDEGEIPDLWLEYPLYNGFQVSFLDKVKKEMKTSELWDGFCTKIHLKFGSYSIDVTKEILRVSKIRKIFLSLPEFWNEYQEMKNQLIEMLEDCKCMENLQVYVYVMVSSKYSLANYFSDIREHAAMVTDLISNQKIGHCEILVTGVNFFEMYFPFVKVLDHIEMFEKENSDLKLNRTENFIGLKIDQGNVFLISYEQYHSLQKHINIHPTIDD